MDIFLIGLAIYYYVEDEEESGYQILKKATLAGIAILFVKFRKLEPDEKLRFDYAIPIAYLLIEDIPELISTILILKQSGGGVFTLICLSGSCISILLQIIIYLKKKVQRNK